ncbi:MAG: flagellar biosynthetic protein FliR [Proteobacteria bacterium]|nr:flagellar biosynthetic protein FliR [Pseudomonadota bacterium]
MTPDLPDLVLGYFIIFARLGAALVLLPGLANPRFPAFSRILFALVTTMVLTPYLKESINGLGPIAASGRFWKIVATESVIGLAFGFWCYCFLHASRFAASIIATVTGLAGVPGQPIDEHDPTSHLGTLLSLVATALVFATDLHLLALRALTQSYEAFPVGEVPGGTWLGQNTISIISGTSTLALQVASPFIVVAVVLNLALGFCSKFTPQLQVYFASLGLTVLLSLAILALIAPGILSIPINAYAGWLENSSL